LRRGDSRLSNGANTAVVGNGISKGGKYVYMLACEWKSAVTVRRRFGMLGRELLKKKFPSESGKSFSIRLVEFVEKEVSLNRKSLNSR
jgi:hypothetical protein